MEPPRQLARWPRLPTDLSAPSFSHFIIIFLPSRKSSSVFPGMVFPARQMEEMSLNKSTYFPGPKVQGSRAGARRGLGVLDWS